MIRIVVADDHPMVRDGLRTLFDSYPDTEMISEVGTGREAVRAAVMERPDVLIMDLGMPDMDGFEVLRLLRSTGTRVPVVLLTARDATDDKISGLTLGSTKG